MLDELAINNLAVKYPNTVDLVREVERMARADAIEEIIQAEKSKFFCIEDLCTGNKRCSDCRVEYLLKLKEDTK